MTVPDIPDITEILARRIGVLERQLRVTREKLEIQRIARMTAEERVKAQAELLMKLLATLARSGDDSLRLQNCMSALRNAELRIQELEVELCANRRVKYKFD